MGSFTVQCMFLACVLTYGCQGQQGGLLSSGSGQTSGGLQRSFPSNTDPNAGGFMDPLMEVIDGLMGPSPDMSTGFGAGQQDFLNNPVGSSNTANLDQNSLNALRNELAGQADIAGGSQPDVFGDTISTGNKKETVPTNEGLSPPKSSPITSGSTLGMNEQPFDPSKPTPPKSGQTLGMEEPIFDPLSVFGEPLFGGNPTFDKLPTGNEPRVSNSGLGTSSTKETLGDRQTNTKPLFGDMSGTPINKPNKDHQAPTHIMSGSPILDSSLSDLNSISSKPKPQLFNRFPQELPEKTPRAQPMVREERINPVVLKEFIPFNDFASTLTSFTRKDNNKNNIKQPFKVNPFTTIIDANQGNVRGNPLPSPVSQSLKRNTGIHYNQCAMNDTRRDARGDVNFFEMKLADFTWRRMQCASGSQWEDHTCHCSKIAKQPAERNHGCKPTLWMDFTYGIQDISGDYSLPNDIDKSLNLANEALCFDGQSYLRIWKFHSYDFMEQIYISLRFKVNVTNRKDPYPIVTNCESGQEEPSFGMVLVGGINNITIFLSTTKTLYFERYVINESGWNTATLRYDGRTFSTMLNGRREPPKPAEGSILRRNAPLVFGYCGRYGYFKGCIDDITVYDCIPPNA